MDNGTIHLSWCLAISYAYHEQGFFEAIKVLFSFNGLEITVVQATSYMAQHEDSLAATSIKRSLKSMTIEKVSDSISLPARGIASSDHGSSRKLKDKPKLVDDKPKKTTRENVVEDKPKKTFKENAVGNKPNKAKVENYKLVESKKLNNSKTGKVNQYDRGNEDAIKRKTPSLKSEDTKNDKASTVVKDENLNVPDGREYLNVDADTATYINLHGVIKTNTHVKEGMITLRNELKALKEVNLRLETIPKDIMTKEEINELRESRDLIERVTNVLSSTDGVPSVSVLQKQIQKKNHGGVSFWLYREAKIIELKTESLLSLQSKYAGDAHKKVNTNLDDLSDKFKPIMIAELYASLYDNTWTDAFEELESIAKKRLNLGKKDDLGDKEWKETVAFLLKILLDSNKRAIEIFEVNKRSLLDKKKLEFIDSNGWDKLNLSKEENDEINNHLTSIQVEYDMKSHLSSDGFIKSEVEKISKVENVKDNKYIKEYRDRALYVCLHIASKSPPVVLDTDLPAVGSETSLIFKNHRYRSYMKGGDFVDYVVLPPLLYVHEKETNILRQGFLKGRKNKEKKR